MEAHDYKRRSWDKLALFSLFEEHWGHGGLSSSGIQGINAYHLPPSPGHAPPSLGPRVWAKIGEFRPWRGASFPPPGSNPGSAKGVLPFDPAPLRFHMVET